MTTCSHDSSTESDRPAVTFAEWAPVTAVAFALGRSRATVHAWVRDGAVRHRDDGSRFLVHVRDVGRYSATRGRRKRLPKDDRAVLNTGSAYSASPKTR